MFYLIETEYLDVFFDSSLYHHSSAKINASNCCVLQELYTCGEKMDAQSVICRCFCTLLQYLVYDIK